MLGVVLAHAVLYTARLVPTASQVVDTSLSRRLAPVSVPGLCSVTFGVWLLWVVVVLSAKSSGRIASAIVIAVGIAVVANTNTALT